MYHIWGDEKSLSGLVRTTEVKRLRRKIRHRLVKLKVKQFL